MSAPSTELSHQRDAPAWHVVSPLIACVGLLALLSCVPGPSDVREGSHANVDEQALVPAQASQCSIELAPAAVVTVAIDSDRDRIAVVEEILPDCRIRIRFLYGRTATVDAEEVKAGASLRVPVRTTVYFEQPPAPPQSPVAGGSLAGIIPPEEGNSACTFVRHRSPGDPACPTPGQDAGLVVCSCGSPGQRWVHAQLQDFPDLSSRARVATRVAGRRWDLTFAPAVKARLPADARLYEALGDLNLMQARSRIMDLPVAYIDLRTPGRATIGPKEMDSSNQSGSPAAANPSREVFADLPPAAVPPATLKPPVALKPPVTLKRPAVAQPAAPPLRLPQAAKPPPAPVEFRPLPGARESESTGSQWRPGAILYRFGGTVEGERNQGVTFATKAGAQIVAPSGGKVKYAGVFRSFGNMIIVDIGEDTLMVLSGFDTLYLEAGQDILSGETLGRMANRESPPPELYMEIRKQGQPVDPLTWLVLASR